MLVNDLTIWQKRALEELQKTYGNSAYLATEGSSSLLQMLIDAQPEDDIFDILKLEINFYRDIAPQFLGELMIVILKDTHTLV